MRRSFFVSGALAVIAVCACSSPDATPAADASAAPPASSGLGQRSGDDAGGFGSGASTGSAFGSGAGSGSGTSSGSTFGSGATSGGLGGSGTSSGVAAGSGSGTASGSGSVSASGSSSGSGADSGPPTNACASSSSGGTGACTANPVAQTFNAGLTYYTQTARNNCGVPWPSDNMYAALSTNLYDSPSGSSACGKCVQLTGKSGTPHTLVIVDQCPASSNPPCTSTHLDLSPQAFDAVQGNMNPGNLPNSQGLAVKFVPCTVTGPIQYSFDSSSMQYYLAMLIENSRYGIQSVKYRSCGSTGGWTAMGARTDGNAHWTIATNPPNPIDLQVTDEWGRVIEDHNITWGAGKKVASGNQFAACP